MGKIVIIGYGGTITTQYDPITGTKEQEYRIDEVIDQIGILEQYNYEVETREIKKIDSTELNELHWVELAKACYEEIIKEDVDGICITHGTDTMGYSSAALSFAIQNLGKPIIFTGSQKSIDELETDAAHNLLNSIHLAKSNLSGIYLCFGGLIIQGTRAVKTRSTSYQAFESINYPYISPMLTKSMFYLSDIAQAKNDTTLSPPIRNDEIIPSLFPYFSDNVFYMDIFPSNKIHTLIDFLCEQNYHGLVIKGYGLGNIPSHFTHRLSSKDVNFQTILSTQCRYEGVEINSYALGKLAKQHGVISARDMPPETAFVKLKWLFAHYEKEYNLSPPFSNDLVKEDIHRPISHEIN